jgi:hypothetical protein
MTDFMSGNEIELLEREHYKVHYDIDRCFKDGEDYPCRTKQLIDSHRALERRLFPGQGEEYANEVERQRYVIAELQRILATRSDEVARLTEIVTMYGTVMH